MLFPRSIEDGLARFANDQQAAVRDVLPRHEELSAGAPYERVLLAILKLSGQDMERVAHFSVAAKRDWRDVLYWAEHPPESTDPQSWDELRKSLGRPDL